MDETRVWQRVMAASDPGQPILEQITDELHDAATYRALAAHCTGQMRAVLCAIAADEQRHARQLKAIYYAETGRCACPEVPAVESWDAMCEALRQRVQGELAGAAAYAADTGPYADVYAHLAAQERHHARLLLRLLERYVCK